MVDFEHGWFTFDDGPCFTLWAHDSPTPGYHPIPATLSGPLDQQTSPWPPHLRSCAWTTRQAHQEPPGDRPDPAQLHPGKPKGSARRATPCHLHRPTPWLY